MSFKKKHLVEITGTSTVKISGEGAHHPIYVLPAKSFSIFGWPVMLSHGDN